MAFESTPLKTPRFAAGPPRITVQLRRAGLRKPLAYCSDLAHARATALRWLTAS